MDDFDEIDARIARAFGTEEAPEVTEENLLKYREYILDHFDKKTILTGREDFLWEEFYVLGPGDPAEYKKLKKTRPSYTDEYELIDIVKGRVERNDLVALVKRLSDKKIFEIELYWLTTKEKKTKDFQLLDDYATWQVNW
ncbi:MAG: hypothetical protein Q8O92_09800 [Candidatus Latescibacter sp.]|nr:hypothetical protein [Candidatus Latescibacter sp.]